MNICYHLSNSYRLAQYGGYTTSICRLHRETLNPWRWFVLIGKNTWKLYENHLDEITHGCSNCERAVKILIFCGAPSGYLTTNAFDSPQPPGPWGWTPLLQTGAVLQGGSSTPPSLRSWEVISHLVSISLDNQSVDLRPRISLPPSSVCLRAWGVRPSSSL